MSNDFKVITDAGDSRARVFKGEDELTGVLIRSGERSSISLMIVQSIEVTLGIAKGLILP